MHRTSLLAALLLAGCSDSSKSDAGPRDAGSNGDASAGADGGGEDGGGPAGPTFCTTLDPAPFFCADFDDGAMPAGVFTRVVGSVATDAQALHVVDDGYVEQEADPDPQWYVNELGFSLKVESLAADAKIVIARIGQHDVTDECRMELAIDGTGIRVGAGGTSTTLTKSLVTGKAARIVMKADATGDGGSVKASVTVDGADAVPQPIDMGCARFPGPPRVSLGRISGAGASDLRFDDVVFDGR